MSVQQRHLDTPPWGSRRCERRPHHQESLRALATRYGGNPKTVFKWRKRSSVADLPTGPREPKSAVLSVEEEAITVAFRRHIACIRFSY
jgi:transposase-like protein